MFFRNGEICRRALDQSRSPDGLKSDLIAPAAMRRKATVGRSRNLYGSISLPYVQCVDRRCVEAVLIKVFGGGTGFEISATQMLLLACGADALHVT